MSEQMKFSLEQLDELVKRAEDLKKEQQKKYDNKVKMENFTKIVKGIARKYGSKWISQEDVEQELWVRVLELINDSNDINNVDENLVADICFKKAVDLYRYSRRRFDSKAELIENANDDEDSKNASSEDYFEALHSHSDNPVDIILYKEVIDIFPADSKERKYVVIKLVENDVIDLGYLEDSDKRLFEVPDGDTEADIIRCLGYTSHCPGSWTVKKRAMEINIKNFLK